MKILCPVSNCDEMTSLINEPVDELYFGIANNNILFSNRRPSTLCNIQKTKEFSNIAFEAIKRGIRLNLTCNAFIYPKNKLKYILEDVLYCYEIGVRDIIVSDINTMLYIMDNCKFPDLKYTLSTCAPTYNSESVKFYESLGINRICLPRHLNIEEISKLARENTNMEFEIIGLNVRCINEDGFCCFEHGLQNYNKNYEGGGCQIRYESTVFSNDKVDNISKQIIKKRFECVRGNFVSACAACMIPEFKKSNIGYFKIAGREFSTKKKIRDIRFIKTCINYTNSYNQLEYIKKVKELYLQIYKKPCDITQCYYN